LEIDFEQKQMWQIRVKSIWLSLGKGFLLRYKKLDNYKKIPNNSDNSLLNKILDCIKKINIIFSKKYCFNRLGILTL